ncbi:MAG: ATPase, T2SS/T4P/T4SS family [Verrucomicrobiales bacterium]
MSDFYITPWERLVFKKNGELWYDSFVFQPMEQIPVTPGTVDYAMDLGGRRFRVNQLVTRGKMRWVMRLLPDRIPDISAVTVPPAAVKAFLEAKQGLFLICGPTGSGKSTTIASTVLYRAERRREHVVSFEDPIEYVYPDNLPSLISQREMGSDDHNFQSALRASLRQAPDVIIIGEIRDAETAEIALQAAETGHVVVATLHTSSASQTVQRFLKLITAERVASAQDTLADILCMVLCQRLFYDDRRDRRFAVHELLLKYDAVTNLIRRGEFKKLDQELETGSKKGMETFEKSLEQRMSEGWQPTTDFERSGFSEDEVQEYLRDQVKI